MEREILFRGKQKYSPFSWIRGLLMKHEDQYFIFNEGNLDSPDNYEVDPKTIGQYTGVKDINDNMIFEGDFVEMDGDDTIHQIHYERSSFVLWSLVPDGHDPVPFALNNLGYEGYDSGKVWGIKVVGNFHDNIELY